LTNIGINIRHRALLVFFFFFFFCCILMFTINKKRVTVLLFLGVQGIRFLFV
jgi:hypothetical protein